MTPRARLVAALPAIVVSLVLGVLAAWPIYQDWWLLAPATAALLLGYGLTAIALRLRWSGLAVVAILLVIFIVTVAPVAVPQSLEQLPLGPLRGVLDGISAVVFGWKQLLTLSLPVGTYQTMLVPAYIVFLGSAFLTTWIAVRGGRFAALAAFPMLVPVAFGTIFGSSALSMPVQLGPIALVAPREVGLWVAAAILGVFWIAFAAGAARRAALRLGRSDASAATRGRATRVIAGVATLLVAALAAVLIAPALDSAVGGSRNVPRDRIEPELIIRQQASPLASYRLFKSDAYLDEALLSVESRAELPERLRFAVLDDYDGVDFHVGSSEADRFTRFPSGDQLEDPVTVRIGIEDGYRGIWVPNAGLGGPPSFSGPRAAELSDAFFVNRRTGAAVAVPGGEQSGGLTTGDGYSAVMSAAPDGILSGRPGSSPPPFDADAMPELAAWIQAQDQPATGEGLTELITRLRERGYLSHAISLTDGRGLWLERLAQRYGTRFHSSAGGHSTTRLEQLFSQLNTQERLAGENASPEMLVAAVGDDEQFAAAAALIARAIGFESRVVLGVRLGEVDAGVPGVPACDAECTGENLAAWIEIRDRDSDWVAMDVTPQLETPPVSLEEGEQLPEFPTTPEERDAREVDPPLGLGEQSDSEDSVDEPDAASWIWPVLRVVGLSLAAIVLLALPLLFLPIAKRRRTRARRAETDPELRALGAWQEMVDRAVDDGVEIPSSASRSDIARALGTAPAIWAAKQVDRAVFSASGLGETEAEWLWAAADADRQLRSEGRTRRRSLRSAYALRSYGVRFRAARVTKSDPVAADSAGTA